MAINPKCLACNLYRDTCTGSGPGCGKWTKIDLDGPAKEVPIAELLPHQIEAPPVHTMIVPEGLGKAAPTPKPAQGIILDGESRLQKFGRIGASRQEQALEAIRKLSHLASNYKRKRTGVTAYTYEWTTEMAEDLLRPIEEALEMLKGELLGCDSPRDHGLIEEQVT